MEYDGRDALLVSALRAWEKQSTLRREEYFGTWAVRICINVCKDIRRKSKPVMSTDDVPEIPAPQGDTDFRLMLDNLPDTLRLPVVLMFLWKNLGFCLIIFLAALQSIPQPLYEYAQLEGAGFFTRAFRITLPMITPTAFLVFVLAWINAFKIFKEVYFIAGAYPDYSVYTLQNYMNNMFGKLNYQLVTAAAYSFGLIVFALFGALFFLQRRAARGLN